VTILCGETGSGKTTQLPKICLALGRGRNKIIGHTQPRRIAARAVATRIAEEINTPLGDVVGFKVRFTDKVSRQTSIKVMTDGILLAETQKDPDLRQYDTLIIDEAHERSLNIDFLLGYIKRLLPKRPDLKVIITSATIDVDKFSAHFNDAPILQVTGRTYPVEIIYHPLKKINNETLEGSEDAILRAIHSIEKNSGDVLIFLPGERDIHDIKKFLIDQLKNEYEVLPLFSRLPVAEQQKIFKQSGLRRIILTTNIAETSLTVPGIKYVIDAGLARVVRYSPRLKIEQLLVEKISQASANQRAGRCGRIAPGTCIRLYEEEDFNQRPEYTDPEILRTSLASVILKMAALNLGPVDNFPFLQLPATRFIQDGYQLLFELGAVDKENQITVLGKQLARLPIDPSLGRILLEAKKENCLTEILIIISALSISDPRERPLEKSEQADAAHLKFHDPESGFISFIKIWKGLQLESKGKTSKAFRIFCQKNFLSFTRMREWQELHRQLLQITLELDFRSNEKNSTYNQIHRALLSGLLGNIGFKDSDGYEYKGARGIKFLIGPKLFRKKNYKWMLAAEIIDTGRLYAQCIAKIDVGWVEKLAEHLVNFEYSNPRWNEKLSRVDATQQVYLYGLIIEPGRTVHFGSIDPIKSRQIFIREGLVERGYESSGSFWAHNLKLIDEIEKLEHKSRRQDILISEDILCQFYDKKIAQDIVNGSGFEFWRKNIETKNSKYLFLTKEYLMQRSADQVDEIQYPEKIEINNTSIELKYHFEPGEKNDGLSIHFPYPILSQLKPELFDWLVPGMIREKVTFMMKGLPKEFRNQCSPLQEAVTEFLSVADKSQEFDLEFIRFVRKKTKSQFEITEKSIEELPSHLKVNYVLLDEKSIPVGEGKNLIKLQLDYKELVTEVIEEIEFEIEQTELQYWPDVDVPILIEKSWRGQTVIGYPALVDRESYVDLVVLDNAKEAEEFHYEGVRRLLKIQLKDKLRNLSKNPPRFESIGLPLQSHIRPDLLKANFVDIIMDEMMEFTLESPRTQNEFDLLVLNSKKIIPRLTQQLSLGLVGIAEGYHLLVKTMNQFKALPNNLLSDCNDQINTLLPPFEKPLFLFKHIEHIPRYIKAVITRLDKYPQRRIKDDELIRDIIRLQDKWIEKVVEMVEKNKSIPMEFIEFQWALQELRVSLFAQELKTPYPISVKRMDQQWQTLVDLK
jgi:ATP-dependent helicase HrpA